ncbi:MAG: DMT family transporter [Halodesulfurarchaeum sp.]
MRSATWGVLLALVSALGFGTLAIFGRLSAIVGLELSSLLAFRFGLATPLVWLPLVLREDLELLGGRDLGIALLLGAGGYATMSFLFLTGVNRIGAGLGAIVLYVYPAMVVLLAALFLEERITRLTVVAVALAIGGVALVVTGQPATVDLGGILTVLLAATVYAGYITVSGTILDRVAATVLTAHVVPAAALTFLVHGLLTRSMQVPATPSQWGVALGIAVFATAVPILTFFAAVTHIGASRTSIVSTLEPVFTVLLGALLLGETLSPIAALGGAVVLAGVFLVQYERVPVAESDGETGELGSSQ